jgi:DNA-binding transcriptional ArsR family regulator
LTNQFVKWHGVGVSVELLRGDELRGTLSPLRRRLLTELREPASATGLAARLGLPRQRLNYHLRELERGGLVELVELRPRRGRTERVVRTTNTAVVVAPTVAGDLDGPAGQDRFAADALLAATARTLDDLAHLRQGAARAGKRLLTFTVEAEVGFARPVDLQRFVDRLADRVAELAAEFDTAGSRRRYRVVVGGHPVRPPARTDSPAGRRPRRDPTEE